MLTVLTVGYPLAPLGPDAPGGAEQVATTIDGALVAAGHRSIVIAPEDSTIAGRLTGLPVAPRVIDTKAIYRAHDACRRAIAAVLSNEHVDLVHLHGTDFPSYMPAGRTRLATLHRWADCYPRGIFEHPRNGLILQCVSDAQRRACPQPADVLVIRNGIDVDRFRPGVVKTGDALTLGRICPEKGIHLAIEAARRAGCALTIAGRLFPYATHLAYFDHEVVPKLSRTIRFVGPVAASEKQELLASARCLLLPSTVAETSSLVAMEALASGTPVVAFRSPALEELIDHGRTGLLVSDVAEMARALERVDSLDPAECRRAAVERCRMDAMTSAYLRAYESIAAHAAAA